MDFLLNRKVLLYWRFTAAVLFAAVFSAFIIIFSPNDYWLAVIIFSFAFLLCLTVFWILPMYFKSISLKVSKGVIILNKGVIIKREYIFPNSQMVYIQKFKLLVSSCFGLQYLVIRGVGHSLSLPPMTQSETEHFKKAVQDIE